MAVAPTGAIYKALKFDGVSSRTYGVYITGEAVYNAPERDVEMIAIPGRNGSFALDKGRFENIEVSYPAGIFADAESDFAEAVSDFRNFLCSRNGYVRLQDEYNPNEYRMAVYKSGLEVDTALLRAGEFEITFECKPQRYLTSGETAVEVTSGDTLTNPTKFPSSPMIEAWGYGTIDLGNDEIVIHNEPIGPVVVMNNKTVNGQKTLIATFDDTYADTGDSIKIGDMGFTLDYFGDNTSGSVVHSGDITNSEFYRHNSMNFQILGSISDKQFNYGTAVTLTGTVTATINSSYYGTVYIVVNMSVAYNGTNTIAITITTTVPTSYQERINSTFPIMNISDVILNSTRYSVGAPIYIDLDIGEAYKIENGSAVSVNNAVTIPAKLPTIASGVNTITFDNTFTQIKVVPRWWKV